MEKYYNKNYFNIKSIKDIINNLTTNSYFSYEYKLNVLKNNWEKVVGEKLYNQTEPFKLYKTTLYVNCVHQGLINTLLFYKDIILSKIQENFNDRIVIKEIIFKFGQINDQNKL